MKTQVDLSNKLSEFLMNKREGRSTLVHRSHLLIGLNGFSLLKRHYTLKVIILTFLGSVWIYLTSGMDTDCRSIYTSFTSHPHPKRKIYVK